MSRKEAPPAVGGSSLLIIFAVLCLTMFALLSLSTVQADKRMADASIEAVRKFYEADAEAERILALLRQGEVPEGVVKEDTFYRYRCEVSDVQALDVEVEVTGDTYRVLRWQMVSTAEWEADDSLNVWNGSME